MLDPLSQTKVGDHYTSVCTNLTNTVLLTDEDKFL